MATIRRATSITHCERAIRALLARFGVDEQALRDGIAAGTVHPFTGPINKQDGSPWLAEGATAPDGDLLGMNFFVEGIKGDIPQ